MIRVHTMGVCLWAMLAAAQAQGQDHYRQLYAFHGGTADGAFPAGSLISVDGTLYGTTRDGGKSG